MPLGRHPAATQPGSGAARRFSFEAVSVRTAFDRAWPGNAPRRAGPARGRQALPVPGRAATVDFGLVASAAGPRASAPGTEVAACGGGDPQPGAAPAEGIRGPRSRRISGGAGRGPAGGLAGVSSGACPGALRVLGAGLCGAQWNPTRGLAQRGRRDGLGRSLCRCPPAVRGPMGSMPSGALAGGIPRPPRGP